MSAQKMKSVFYPYPSMKELEDIIMNFSGESDPYHFVDNYI
jgi:hypothetical protein